MEKLSNGHSLEALTEYGTDLTRMAEGDKLDPVIGRQEQIEQVMQILCKKKKNNACLLGDPGVGKTVIAEGLAIKIAKSDVPPMLIFSLDMGRVMAGPGSMFVGGLERSLTTIVDEVRNSNGQVILFIDELHTLFGRRVVDAANVLKPPLARGELKCIGATTLKEYRKYIEKDPALKRRFQVVQVPEPSIDETIHILQGLKNGFQLHHKVTFLDDALITSAKLSKQYLSDAFLPDKAVDVVDEAGARMQLYGYKKTGSGYGNNVVTSEVIKEVISSRTGIPLEKVSGEESKRLLEMEKILREHVIGQDEAIEAVARAIRRARVGFSDPDCPVASLLFTGPTGVGKTEVSKLLALEYFGSKESMVRLDMSEFHERHTVARLLGSPPGYIGHDDGGQLTEAIRRKPHSLILLDEIEKAHPDVFNALLQVLDDGRLTDGKGNVVDFKNTIIIMTSNIGFDSSSHDYDYNVGAQMRDVIERLKKAFKPEFLNRLDEVILFKRLGENEMMKIVEVMLKQVCKSIKMSKNISLDIRTGFKEKLVSEIEGNIVKNYGARPLKRAITRNLADKLSENFLNGTVKEGDSLIVNVDSKGDVLLLPSKWS